MPQAFLPAGSQPRPVTWRWRSHGRNHCAAQVTPAAAGVHEAMEKLATADDIAAAVRAIRRTARSA